MTTKKDIPLKNVRLNSFNSWEKEWFLLTSGVNKPREFNSMTVAWGSFGLMWGKPMCVVVVRPQRHTFGFLEKVQDFTLSCFGPEYKRVLNLMGTKSGRDMDKIDACGLTPVASEFVSSPSYMECKFNIECEVVYEHVFKPEEMKAEYIPKCYKEEDYHHVFYGEVKKCSGTEDYDSSVHNN